MPDVLPVATELVRVHALAVLDHPGQDVAAEVRPLRAEQVTQGRPAEDVHAHADEVRARFRRLLHERGHPALAADVEDAEPVRVLDRDPTHGAGHGRPLLAMHGDERPVIHLVDVVAGQDEDELRRAVLDEVEVLEHGVRRSAVPVPRPAAADERLEQRHAAPAAVEIPRSAHPDVVDEAARSVLGQDPDVGKAGVHGIRQGEVDDPVLPAEWHAGLGTNLRQDAESLSLTPRQDERQDRA